MQPIEIRPNRFTYLIPIPFILFLMYLFYWAIFVNQEMEHTDNMFYVIAGFVFLVGSFLVFMFGRSFLLNPVAFRINDEGLESIEGGVSTGFIRWEEIREVRETLVPGSKNRSYIKVLAIYLHNPSKHVQRYNPALQAIANLADATMGTAIYITRSMLGKKYDAIELIIRSKTTFRSINEQETTAVPEAAYMQTAVNNSDADQLSANWAINFVKQLYDIRMGKRKADKRIYLLYLAFVVAIVHDVVLNTLPFSLVAVVFVGLAAIIVYAIFASRTKKSA